MWLLLLASMNLCVAEEPAKIIDEADYVEVQLGAPAPFEGLLFTTEAISTIILKHEEELSLLHADHDFQIKNLKSNQ